MCAKERAPRFTALEFFERSILVNAKISEIIETIHVADRNIPVEEEESHSCISYIYRFDEKGNLTSETLARVGTDYGFVYDQNNKLYDWTWKNKSTGEVTSFREVLKDKPREFKQELANREARVYKHVSSSIPHSEKITRFIGDPCYGIEAEYKITHKSLSSDLPTSANAVKVRDVGRFAEKGIKSPEKLHIYYDYKYFE